MANVDSIQPKTPHQQPPIEPKAAHLAQPEANQAKISLLFPKMQSARQGNRKKRVLKFILSIIIIAIVGLGALVVIRAANLSSKIFVGQKTSFFQKITQLLRGGGGDVRLIGENLGQINILLMGIGGEGHDGPYLTDTMILAQIRPDTGQVALVSIPRDYFVQLPHSGEFAKINAAFTAGFIKNKDWDSGELYAREAAQKLSGLTIPYFAIVDFSGFEKAINMIGGVDVNVERTFTDQSFPNDATAGYLPPITFEQGWQHMNGEKALQFARSRHAAGPEGSDFARSQRQQKIIKAFKNKAINLNLISDAGKINNLAGIFADHFHTNISPAEVYRIYQLTKNQNVANFVSVSLDPDTTKLVCPKIQEGSGAYTLVPCEGKNEADIENFFKNIFATGRLYQEKSVIWLSDSGKNKANYQAALAKLQETNLTVWELPYTGVALPYNIFYQVNQKPGTAEFIKNTLNAREVSLPPPGVKVDKSKVDIIVILGENN